MKKRNKEHNTHFRIYNFSLVYPRNHCQAARRVPAANPGAILIVVFRKIASPRGKQNLSLIVSDRAAEGTGFIIGITYAFQ